MREANLSCSVSRQLKDTMVRIVHAGGRVEMYHTPFPASELIQKYPGFCVTYPQVFKRPNESVLPADKILKPGRKYFLMKCSSVEKLKRRQSRKGRISNETTSLKSEEIEDVGDVGDVSFEESICSAQNFFVSTDTEDCSNVASKKTPKEKKPFVPPIQKLKLWKVRDWEPSLNSIKELSP